VVTGNPFWDFISGLLKDPTPEQAKNKLRNLNRVCIFCTFVRLLNLTSDFPNLFINQTQSDTADPESSE
jgi:hypothetical protein